MKTYIIPAVTITETQTASIIAVSLGIYEDTVNEQGAKKENFWGSNIWDEEEVEE